MTIWLLAILLLAALAGLGLKMGAIRVGFSFVGILLGVLLAAPIGHLIRPGIAAVGLKNPLWLALLPPCIAFLMILTVFKIAGFAVHRKVYLYYQHRAADLQRTLWERLDQRLGFCLGLLNGAAYLVLASAAIYVVSYWTYQLATEDSNPRAMRIVNRLGKDLESSKMDNVAVAVDKMPDSYYQAADIVGLIYHNPLLEARLSRYPAFLALGERPEFQDLASDMNFNNDWLAQKPVAELIKNPKVQAILNNHNLLKSITDTVVPDLPDLRAFLETGKSQKYGSEQILGRWDFDPNGAVALAQKAKPDLTPAQAQALRQSFAAYFSKLTLVAAPGGQAFLENFPRFTPPAAPGTPPTVDLQRLEGQWSNDGGKYDVKFNIGGRDEDMTGTIEGDRLSISGPSTQLAFAQED